MSTKQLYKATFIKVGNEWVEDTTIPREPLSATGERLTSDDILKMLKSFSNQNTIWEKLEIGKQLRLVE